MDVNKVIFKVKNKYMNKIVDSMESFTLKIVKKEIQKMKGMLDDWVKNLN